MNIDPKVIKTKNNSKMMLSRFSICNNKKSTFISQGSGIFDSLVYNTTQNKIKNALWILLIDKIMHTYKI